MSYTATLGDALYTVPPPPPAARRAFGGKLAIGLGILVATAAAGALSTAALLSTDPAPGYLKELTKPAPVPVAARQEPRPAPKAPAPSRAAKPAEREVGWADIVLNPRPLFNASRFALAEPAAPAPLPPAPLPPAPPQRMALLENQPVEAPLPPVLARPELARPELARPAPDRPEAAQPDLVPFPPRRPRGLADKAPAMPVPPVLEKATPAPIPRQQVAIVPKSSPDATQPGSGNPLARLFSALSQPASPSAYPRPEGGGSERVPGLAYSRPASGPVSPRQGSVATGSAPASASGRTALYDIAAHTVYLPNGERLEAHSGLGNRFDDIRSIAEKNRGVTPPNTYDLSLREQLFHGVAALRMTPVGDGKMFGRDGMLAHTYMLGARGDSNGCVSFRDYARFLRAFQNGEVNRLVVVTRAGDAPVNVASSR